MLDEVENYEILRLASYGYTLGPIYTVSQKVDPQVSLMTSSNIGRQIF